MVNGIKTDDPCGFNKGHSSKFREGSWVRQTPEEGRKTYQRKSFENNSKDEDDRPKTLNDKNHQALSQEFDNWWKPLYLRGQLFEVLESPRGVMTKVQNSNFEVSEFKL